MWRGPRGGTVLDGDWFCSAECLDAVVRARLGRSLREPVSAPAQAPSRLGAILAHQRAITVDQLHGGLAAQKRTGLRLGAQLRALGYVTDADVLRALAFQAGIAYLTTPPFSQVAQIACGIPPEAAGALGLVPFEADEKTGRLKVACVAPLPRRALAALRDLTGWVPEAFFVADDAWASLQGAYAAAARREPAAAPATIVRTMAAAAERVVRAARQARTASLFAGQWEPYVWVRVEGPDSIEDVLLPTPDRTEGGLCLAVPTSH
jgi:hypothetical protein